MKYFLITLVALSSITFTLTKPRMKRSPYELAMDYDKLLDRPLKETFSCEGLRFGYYADMDNDCKIFHICHPRQLADGSGIMEHYSFICGNQTVFNQFSQTCAHPDEAIPCEQSRDFYYLNERYGVEDENFHRDEDVNAYNNIISEFGSRKRVAGGSVNRPNEVVISPNYLGN